MSLNQSMSITLGSMRNNQYALTVVAQNISNINTEGYVRQRINFQTNEYTTDCENVISTIKGMNGASVSSLTDFIDDALFDDLVGKNADAEYYNKVSDLLGDLEAISDDLGDNGLNSILGEFYAASANLEKYPTDISIRQQFVIAAQNVAEKFNEVSSRYDAIKENKLDTIQYNVSTMNSLFNELAQSNKAYLDNGGSAQYKNDINKVIQELSNYTNVRTEKNTNGTVNLYIGNTRVVSGTEVKYNLEADIDSSSENPISFKFVSTEDDTAVITNGVNDAFKAGSMGAYLSILNGTNGRYTNLNDMKTALNSAASAFATAVNNIQTYDTGDVFAASITTDPATGDLILEKATNNLFTTSDGDATFTASNIQINSDVASNPFLVAAARIDLTKYQDDEGNLVEDWTKAIGNSDNAAEFTALRNKKICKYGNSPIENCTLSDFLIYNAGKNGAEAANAERQANTYQDILDNAAENYSNLIGVNLDEELADMIKYQRSYEASAKLFTVIDSIMAMIINMV